jgi:hypothetical protein
MALSEAQKRTVIAETQNEIDQIFNSIMGLAQYDPQFLYRLPPSFSGFYWHERERPYFYLRVSFPRIDHLNLWRDAQVLYKGRGRSNYCTLTEFVSQYPQHAGELTGLLREMHAYLCGMFSVTVPHSDAAVRFAHSIK